MTVDELDRARKEMEKDLCLLTDPEGLKQQLLIPAVEYLNARVSWSIAKQDERKVLDAGRTRAHDAFLVTLNMVTRQAARSGSQLQWRKDFAHHGEAEERRTLGDFACYLAFQSAVAAR